MLTDAQSLPAGHVVATDVCIVGAGPAGLTLARELAGGPLRVTVLDSGAAEPDDTPDEVRRQFHGTATGDGYPPLQSVHAQGLGGTIAMWDFEAKGLRHAVRLRRLEAADFERRSWVPNSGWPFSRDELDPYYDRAEDAFGIGRIAEDVTEDSLSAGTHPLALGNIAASEYRFAPAARFMATHRPILERSPNVDVIVNATVVELETDDDPATVGRAQVQSGPGHGFAVDARWFVLAAGGIDNARLLLLSDRTHAGGLGNHHDNVGRYFMDHPGAFGAYISLRDSSTSQRLHAYDTVVQDGVGRLRSLTIRPEVLEREQMMHSFAVVQPRVNDRYRNAIASLREVSRTLRPGGRAAAACHSPHSATEHVRNLARGIAPLALAAATGTRAMRVLPGWSHRPPRPALFEPTELQLNFCLEQAPNPDSRISLDTRADRLGRRLARLDYRWSDIDVHSATRTKDILDKELSVAGIGSLEVDPGRGFPDRTEPSSPHHPMGSTRMHRDPKHGVVDENGRVHGIKNLSVVGSSTFTTGGSANPTLTIVALGIRLADHLKRTLR